MGIVELVFISIGLAMDAFAVSIGKGLSMKQLDMRHAFVIALFFGGFQALMPIVGWALGAQFAVYVEAVDHWIAFGLLTLIGAKMIWDAIQDDPPHVASQDADCNTLSQDADHNASSQNADRNVQEGANLRIDLRELLLLAVATSVDALAMGVTFAFLKVDILCAAVLIGVITFSLSLAGVCIGHQFGSRWEKPSSIAGGVVLIIIGCKTLIEHLMV